MTSVPTANPLVVQTAVRDEPNITALQPAIAVPLEVKLTVPVGNGGPAGPTVAVMVTNSPNVDGLGELVTEVMLGGGPDKRKTVPQPPSPDVHAGLAPYVAAP